MTLNVKQAIPILLVIISAVVALQTYILQLDTGALPFGIYLKAIFSTASVTIIISFLVNIGGYIENIFGSDNWK